MRKYIVMGAQGSGKGTQAKLLAETFDLEHINVGDIFRWNVEHHTKLGAQARRIAAARSTTGTTASSSTASPATGPRPGSSWRATTSTPSSSSTSPTAWSSSASSAGACARAAAWTTT